MKKTTLTIGIPAYNEETNIESLIRSIVAQNLSVLKLVKIIVYSDGSTDKTNKIIKSIHVKKLKLIGQIKRQGKAHCLNQIIAQTKSDVLVLLDADTHIKDKLFLSKLISPILNTKADLTSARVVELPAKNQTEKLLSLSMQFKKQIYEQINGGNNIYTCHGRARAFSKKFYQQLKFEDSISEDSYSYLRCMTSGYKYQFAQQANIYYQLPGSLADHELQSLRFIHSQKILEKYFGQENVRRAFAIPWSSLFIRIVKYSLINPLFIFYVLLTILNKLKASFSTTNVYAWKVSSSSKKLT